MSCQWKPFTGGKIQPFVTAGQEDRFFVLTAALTRRKKITAVREEPTFTAKPPPEVSFKGMVAVGEGGEGVILSSQIDPQLMTDV